MASRVEPLTATKVQSAKPKEKNYKLSDGRGLFLLIKPTGSKLWRLKYRFNGKEKEFAIGAYPTITLSKARKRREELKTLIADGIDPNEQKKQEKQQNKVIEAKKENTFYAISQKWLKSYKSEVSENYHIKLGRALENYTYKKYDNVHIKDTPIDEVTRLDIIAILEALREKELHETARRTFQILNKVYLYAVTHEYTPHNIIADIDKQIILGKKQKRNYPTFTKQKDIKGLLLAIDEYEGSYTTKMALKVLPYVFVRSYNIRHMEWKEIDFNAKEWVMPADKMKMKKEFILPLPHQVITLLEELKENSLSAKYVFPSPIHKDRPLSDNALISALRRMGYTKEEFVPHSFRAMFSTIANEQGKKTNHIEALLAHKNTNEVEGAYNRAEYKKQKREVLAWYADYLEEIKNG
jgi:integrase